ncbi:uncharacterized protein STEHIDRAFT_151144 [Stereum hirsutum FP-91666 SS1]|uniref:uncharacterized protein n=1 Tax=Stereum hirsutum (strain FP-91666) TaxID=721885 RepID=UPI000440AE0F|nr:uncharacterized protein STEHIDRAFT_151144 [Stereum hirsutum FP-91666 SS1]EIM91784.1 hypothetical protein STEHIDRAFT_151144 [Stereum hirsutum FP-91666 SS1]
MFSSTSIALASVLFLAGSSVFSMPTSSNVTLSSRDDSHTVHCGTTSDATLSDCQALVELDTWNAAYAGTSNTCHYTNVAFAQYNRVAYNVACHGNCCAYYAAGSHTTASVDSTTVRERAASLLGCGDTKTNKINGLEVAVGDGSGVCLSNGNGCGDCFDDRDFTP